MDVLIHNRAAWDKRVDEGDKWTIPVSSQEVTDARQGKWEIVLTPIKPVPREWFGRLEGADVLGLASGGGQQAPILAAAGANVTVLDNSPRQLGQDQAVAQRDGLTIHSYEGDMADLSRFADESFDLIFHPVSNCFAPQVRPVWAEAFRVLRPGGRLLAGFVNPVLYLFDNEKAEAGGPLEVINTIPYSDAAQLSPEEKARYAANGYPLEFGHTLQDQIGGQLDVGFVLTGFYDDRFRPGAGDPLSAYIATFIATCAVKPAQPVW